MKSARAISSYSAARSIAFSDGGKSSGGDGSSRSKSTKRAGQSNTLKQLLKSKTIGFFSGICLLVNAMTGPAIPYTPSLFQQGGWLPPIFFFILFATLSTLSCLFIVEAMQAIPGNKHFQGVVEFGTLVNFYFGKKAHILAQICLFGAIQSNAVQSIVLSAQALDNILVDIANITCGVSLSDLDNAWQCVHSLSDASPFAVSGGNPPIMLFTLGFLFVMILVVPMGMLNFDSNVSIQVATFCITVAIVTEWIIASIVSYATAGNPVSNCDFPSLPNSIPVIQPSGIGNLIGTILLSVGFTFVVPSWINAKDKSVNAQSTLWYSALIAMLMYVFIGIFPAIFLPIWRKTDCTIYTGGNILPMLQMYGSPSSLTKVAVYLFAIVMLLPSIPVACIVSKNNLIQNKLCRNDVATFLSFVIPWIVSIPFLTNSSSLQQFQNWTSLLFVGGSNFVVPLIIYLKCHRFRSAYNRDRGILNKNQRELLKTIHSHSREIAKWVDYNSAEKSGLKSQHSRHYYDGDDSSRSGRKKKQSESGENELSSSQLNRSGFAIDLPRRRSGESADQLGVSRTGNEMPRQISGIKQSSIIPNSPIDEQKQRPIDFPQQAPFVNRRTTSQRTNSSGEKNDAFGRQHRRTPSAGQDSALKRLYASSPPTSPDSSRRKLVSLSDDSDASDQEKKEHEPSLAPSTNSSGSRSVKAKSENINALIHINLGNKNMADGEQELQDGEAAAGGVVEGRDGSIPIKGTSQNNCRSLGPSFNSLNNSFNRSNVSMGLAYMTPPASSSKNITEDALLGLPPIEIKSSSDTNLFVQHHQQQGQLLQVPSLASSSKTSSSCSFGGSAAPVPAAAARMCEDIIETSNLEYPSDNEKDNDEDLEPFLKSMRAFKALDSTSEIKKEAISSVGDDEELVDVEVLVLAKVRARAISLDTGSDRKSNKSTSRRPSQNSQVSAADIVRRRSVTFMMNDNYLSLPKDIENMNHHSDEEEEEEEQDVGARVFKSSLTKSSSSSGQQSRLKRTAVNEVKTASQLNEMTAGSGEDINNIPEDVELDKKKKESILPRRRTYSGDSKKSVKGGIIPNNGNQSTDTMLKSSVDNSIGQTFIFHPSLGRSVGVKRVSSNKESGNGQGETRKRSSSDKNIRVEQIVKQGGDATSDGSDSVNTNSLKKRPSLKKKSYLAPIDTRAGTGSSGIPSAGSARFPRSLSSINSAIQRMGGQPSGVPAVVNTSLEGYINTSNPMVFKNNNTGVGASGDYISAVLGSDHELETHISYKIGRAASTSLTNLPDVLPQELEYLCQDVPDPDEEDKQLKRKSKPQQQHLNSSLGLSAAKRVWGATKAKLGASHSVPVAAKNANISGDKLPNTSGGDLELGVINTSSGNALHVISSAGVIDWPLMIASEEDGAGTGVRAFAAPNIVLPNSPTSTEPEELNMSVNISNSNNNNNGGGSPTFPRKGHPANFSRQLSIGASSINNQAGIGRRDDDGKLGLGMMEFRSQIKGGNGGLSGSYNSVASFGLLEKVAPNFTRTMSLPMVAGFVSTTFRSLPRWVTSHIPARYIALSCLWILMTLLLFSLAWTSCSTYDGFMGTNWCTSFVDVGPFYSPGYNATGISNMTSASKH